MTLYIKPIVVSIFAMDRENLISLLPQLQSNLVKARRQAFPVWLRNKAVAIICFILLIAAVVTSFSFVDFIFGNEQPGLIEKLVIFINEDFYVRHIDTFVYCRHPLIIGIIFANLIFWLFYRASKRLDTVTGPWEAEEEALHDEVQAEEYVLKCARLRLRELNRR